MSHAASWAAVEQPPSVENRDRVARVLALNLLPPKPFATFMTDVLAQLRAEHTEILRVLSEIRDLGPSSDGGCAALETLRALLGSHAVHEKALCDTLVRAAREHPALAGRVDGLNTELREVVDHTKNYFDQRSKGVADARQFGRLYAALAIHVGIEEQYLIPTYEQCVASNGGVLSSAAAASGGSP